jgi:transposase
VAIDTASQQVLSAVYTSANRADGQLMPALLARIEGRLQAVCADMAYDTVRCRGAVWQRGAEQRIPPRRQARLSRDNRNLRPHRAVLAERDAAILAIGAHARTLSPPGQPPDKAAVSAARRQWKEAIGYGRRSLAETTMARLKAHTTDRLRNRREATRETQALLKCATLNQLLQAA